MASGNLKGSKLTVITLIITIFLLGSISTVEAKRISDEEAEEIKTFLKISNVPGLRNYSEEDLKKLLNKVIKPEIPDVTYGLLVLSAKDDLEWIDMILSQDYVGKNREYFNSVLDRRLSLFSHWKGVGQDIYFFVSKGDQLGPLSGLASEIVSITNKTVEIFTLYEVWKTTETYKGIWRYFDSRRGGESHEVAWQDAKAEMGWDIETKTQKDNIFRGKKENKREEEIGQQFVQLYEKWGPYATPWGIDNKYKEQLASELKDVLLVALENQNLAEEKEEPSWLVQQLDEIKALAASLKENLQSVLSKVNPFQAGPIVDVVDVGDQQHGEEEISEVEMIEAKPTSIEEPDMIEVSPQSTKAEIQPIIDESNKELIEVSPQSVEELETEEVEPQSDELQEAEEVLPEEEAPEPESTPEPAPTPEEVVEVGDQQTEPQLCEKRAGDLPSRFKVLINEVAWMGTVNSSNDEWIELRNVWSMPVNLSGWQLLDKDKQIKIVFGEADIIPTNGFYLLERTDDDSMPNITADVIYTGALNNTDETLYLFDADCQIEDEVVANPNWPAGDNIEKRSMERLDPLNWYTSNSAGTAKAENSPPPIPSSAPSSPEPEPEPTPQAEEPILTVVINEIAWMGTASSYNDEWIELYNNTASNIDITGWRLTSVDGSPDITFPTSTISTSSFYLIERTDDNTVSDIVADYTGSFGYGLSNSGEKLELRDVDNNLIDVVDCSSGWFAGVASPDYVSMERIDSSLAGSDPDNWASNNGVPWEGWQGRDADGNRIQGTPKSENSVSKNSTTITSGGFTIDNDLTLTLLGSPYSIEGSINVLAGARLTIEPGVTIKFKHSEYWKSELKVEGELSVIGTETQRIIFTSSSTEPLAGDWEWLNLQNSSSTLENVTIQYAGKREGNPPASPPFTRGAVYIDGGAVSIENSIIEQSQTLGIWLKNSSATVINNAEFLNIEGDWEKPAALYIESSNPAVQNSTFRNNNLGILVEGSAAPTIQNNIFENNQTPIKSGTLLPVFSGNTAQNNNLNGILFTSFGFSESIAQINWQKANLPFILEGAGTISAGKTLNINPGVIIKLKGGGRIYIDGALRAQGTPTEKIVFTSLSQESAGTWDFISFSASSTNSILDNVIIKYGGWYNAPFESGAVKIESNDVVISNSLFENNLIAGLELENCTTTITDTIFKDHRAKYNYNRGNSKGLWMKNALSVFTNTVFNNNYYGLYVESGECPALAGATFGEGDEANSINIYPPDCSP